MADSDEQDLLRGVRPWTRHGERDLLTTRVFSIRSHLGRSPDGSREAPFVVMHTTDWVNVIAHTPDGRLVFVEQYRHGTDEVTLEIPGGMVDPGEDHVTAALRELQEETGYHPAADARSALIGVVAPNPAIQANRCGTVLVGPVLPGPASPDENEELHVRLLPPDAVAGLIRTGVIDHALVVAAFHHLHLHGGVDR